MTKYKVTCRGHARNIFFLFAEDETDAEKKTEEKLNKREFSFSTGDLDISDFYDFKGRWLTGNLYSVHAWCDCMADFYIDAESKEDAHDRFLERRQKGALLSPKPGDLILSRDWFPIDITVDEEAVDYFDDGFGYFGKKSNQTKLFYNI